MYQYIDAENQYFCEIPTPNHDRTRRDTAKFSNFQIAYSNTLQRSGNGRTLYFSHFNDRNTVDSDGHRNFTFGSISSFWTVAEP